jgi:hypothetical protein
MIRSKGQKPTKSVEIMRFSVKQITSRGAGGDIAARMLQNGAKSLFQPIIPLPLFVCK